ncbi:MAG: 50S ribosomal protein L10 [Thermoflavifilum sp.]|nr:50S ribosomal protein L10 [Thermoflavifilum sp.]
MNKAQKNEVIARLKEKFSHYPHFYLADSSALTVEQVNKLRRACFNGKVEMKVAKNTLIRKALESIEPTRYSSVFTALKGQTAIFFTENPKEPALIISRFRKEQKSEKPILKLAYIDSEIYEGDTQLETLTQLKSKADLLGELISLLQSPVHRVVGALQSGGQTLSGVLKTLETKASS